MTALDGQNQLNTTHNAVWIPEVIADKAINRLAAYLDLGRTVTKDSELTQQQVGEVISVPKFGSVSSNDLAQNGDVTVQTPTATNVQVTLTRHKEVTIGELDYARSVQKGSALPGYFEQGVMVLAEDIENDLASLWSDFTINNDGTADRLDDFVDMRKALIMNKVPKRERMYAYVHPTVVASLLKSEAFQDPKVIPNNQALTEGAVGRVSGFDVFEGQLVVKSGSPGVYRNIFYTKQAMVLATRPQPLPEPGLGAQGANVLTEQGIALQVVRSYNATKLGNQITVHVVYGYDTLDERQGAVLDTTA